MPLRVDVSADDLASTRFAVSPLFETVEALRTLRQPGRRAVHLPWIRNAQQELRRQPLSLPRVWPLLIEPRRQPEFLMPAPRSRMPDLADELDVILTTKPAQVRAVLARTFPRRPPPEARALAARPHQELKAVVAELESAFDRLIAPHWERIRSVLDADILYRARTLADVGPAEMFERLHSGVEWHRDHLVFTDVCGIEGDPEVAVVGQGGLVVEPSAFIWPDVYVKRWTLTRTTVRYPCRGVALLWDALTDRTDEPLAELIGRRRADLLVMLRSPRTTTELAHRLGVTPSAISQHLGVLRAAGLITSETLGRQRLHMITETGGGLLEPQRTQDGPR